MKRKIAIALLTTCTALNALPVYALPQSTPTEINQTDSKQPKFDGFARNPYFEILWYVSNTPTVNSLYMYDISDSVEAAKKLGVDNKYYLSLQMNPEDFTHKSDDLSFINKSFDTSNLVLGPQYSFSNMAVATTYGDLSTLDLYGLNCQMRGIPLSTEGFQELINEAKAHSVEIDFDEPLRKVYEGLHDMSPKKSPDDFRIPLNDPSVFSKLPKGISGYTITVRQDEFDNTLPTQWLDSAISSNSHMRVYLSERVTEKGETNLTTDGYDISDLFTTEQLKKLTKVQMSSDFGDVVNTNSVAKVKSRKSLVLKKNPKPDDYAYAILTFNNKVEVYIDLTTETTNQYGYEVKSESGEILCRETTQGKDTLTYKSPGVFMNGTFELYEEPQFINKVNVGDVIPESEYTQNYGFKTKTVYLKYIPYTGDTKYEIKSEDGTRTIATFDVPVDGDMPDMPIDPQLDKNRYQIGVSYEDNSRNYVEWPTKNYSSSRGDEQKVVGYIVTDQKPRVQSQGVYEGKPNSIQLNFNKNLFSKVDNTDIPNFTVKVNSEVVPVTSIVDVTDNGFKLELPNRIYRDDKVEVIITCDKVYQETLTISNNTTTERPAGYLSSVVGGSAPTGQVKLNLNKASTFDFSLTDASDFTLTADNQPVQIVDVTASIGDRNIALYYSGDLYKGQDIKLSYNGNKLEGFNDKQVTNLLTTPNPSPSNPSIVSAVVENNNPNKIIITLDKQPVGDVTTTSNWSVVLNTTTPTTVTNVSISDRVITVELDHALKYGDTANITYSGSNIQGITAYTVQNNVQKVELPKYVSAETKDETTITVTTDKEVDTSITNDIQDFQVKINNKNAVIQSIQQNTTTLDITISGTAIKYGDTISLSYTGDKIEQFTDSLVSNNIPESLKITESVINKDTKDTIKITFTKPINSVTIADVADFTVTKNSTPLAAQDILDISSNDKTLTIKLKDEAVSTDTFSVSYTGSKIDHFTTDISVNIKPQIINGATSDGKQITLTLDEPLVSDISSDLKSFKVFVNGRLVNIASVTGAPGSTDITIDLADTIYANDIVEISYLGTNLVRDNNISIHNNVTVAKPKIEIRDAYIQGGYVSDTVVVLLSDSIKAKSNPTNFKVVVDGKPVQVLSQSISGSQVTLQLDTKCNYKQDLKISIQNSPNIEDTDSFVVQNRLFNTGGLNITINGNIVLPGGVIIVPTHPNLPPTNNGNGTITIPGGIIKPGDSNNSGDVTVDGDANIDTSTGLVDIGNGTIVDMGNGTVTLPGGIIVKPGNGGDITIGNGNVQLPDGGTIKYPDGSENTLKPGDIIDATNPPSNSNNSTSTSGGNSSIGSGGGAVIGNSNNSPGSNTKPEPGTNTNSNTNTNSTDSWIDDILTNLEENRIIDKKDYIDKLDNDITREEFAKLIVSLLENSYDISLKQGTNEFNDLTDNSPLLKLTPLNIFRGYNDGTIKPNKLISREEAAVVVTTLSKYLDKDKINEGTPVYNDNLSIRWWSKNYVTEAFRYNIMLGDDDNNFRPQSNLTVSDALSIINQYI